MNFSDILDSKTFDKRIDSLFSQLSSGKGTIFGWIVIVIAAFFVVKNSKSVSSVHPEKAKEYSDE